MCAHSGSLTDRLQVEDGEYSKTDLLVVDWSALQALRAEGVLAGAGPSRSVASAQVASTAVASMVIE